jgi:hypothetical protein
VEMLGDMCLYICLRLVDENSIRQRGNSNGLLSFVMSDDVKTDVLSCVFCV